MLDEKNRVPVAHVKDVIRHSEIEFEDFGSCTICKAKLPNGYTVVTTSGCIDPDNYDGQVGREICLRHLEDEVWRLEGYVAAGEFMARTQDGSAAFGHIAGHK